MPYKFETDKLKIPKEKGIDGRIKLSDEDKRNIVRKYATGLYSQRQLAAEYGVSRRLIVYTIYPERIKRTDSSKYYDKDKQREYTKKHRHHKKELYEKGILYKESEVENEN